mmetsp:Transcript_3166/g.9237  ORF Transcript_3166/g.9237 Transcript_3166/m.9237 type:complete len:180 (-) Transcript_3166:106-645(-)
MDVMDEPTFLKPDDWLRELWTTPEPSLAGDVTLVMTPPDGPLDATTRPQPAGGDRLGEHIGTPADPPHADRFGEDIGTRTDLKPAEGDANVRKLLEGDPTGDLAGDPVGDRAGDPAGDPLEGEAPTRPNGPQPDGETILTPVARLRDEAGTREELSTGDGDRTGDNEILGASHLRLANS